MSILNAGQPLDEGIPRHRPPLYRILGITCALAAVLIGILGLVGLLFGIPVLTSIVPGLKQIAVSACLGWIILGLVFAFFVYRPLTGIKQDAAIVVVFVTAVVYAIELPLNISGDHFFVEAFLLRTEDAILPISSTPISPLAVILIIASSVALFLLLAGSRVPVYKRQIGNWVGILGSAIALVSFTILLSYLYGNPFLYGTVLIPIAINAALAGLFMGAGFIVTAGPESLPLSYVTGPSIRARLLRMLLPLLIVIIFVQNFLDRTLFTYLPAENTIFVTILLVGFTVITSYIVGKISGVFSKSLEREQLKRRIAEDAERETNEYLTNLFQYANAPIIVWDPQFRITQFNHAFERLTGRTQQEVIGQHLEILFPEKSKNASLELIKKTLEGVRWESVEIPIQHINGESKIALWNSANIVDPRGILISTIAQGQDITDRKAIEHKQKLLIKELEQKNAELERFTYTVSHDLKSPLITIKGFAGLIEDDVHKGDPVQLEKDILRIITAADTMQVLLADLLKLSQVGRIVGPPEKVGFDTLVHDAVNLLAIPLAERGVAVEIAPDLPEVNVDRTRIREVLVNLIENAIKFLGDRQNPVIRIGMEMKGETPVFFVQDNGIGIEQPYLERIFNLFEKLDVNSQGAGMGLTIVRRIIEFHGGKIWAESEGAGKGTTFRFTLPASGDRSTDNNNNSKIKE